MEFKMKVAVVVLVLFVRCSASFMMEEEMEELSSFSEGAGEKWWAPSRKAPLYSHKFRYDPHVQGKRQGDEFRLPSHLIPISYALVLTPIIEPGNFTTLGTVDIFVNCTVDDSSDVVLNSADLVIHQSSIKVRDTFIAQHAQ